MTFTLLTVIVPPEKMSFGRSSVACWMKPTMSNCDATAGTCAVVGVVIAGAIAMGARADVTFNLRANIRAPRAVLLFIVPSFCSLAFVTVCGRSRDGVTRPVRLGEQSQPR